MSNLTYTSALLPNYTRHRVLDADYPAILHDEGGEVRGTLVTGLTEGDVWRLDVFEGEMYERRKVGVRVKRGVALGDRVEVDGGEGEVVTAETYVWINPKEELEATEWDFEVFKREKMRAWMGMADGEGVEVDEGFGDVDRAVAEKQSKEGNGHVKDPTGGRGVNGKISRQLEETRR